MPLPHKNSGNEYLVHTDAFWNKPAQSDTNKPAQSDTNKPAQSDTNKPAQSDTNVDLKLRISELETKLTDWEIAYNNYKEQVLAWRRKDKEDYQVAIARVEETLAWYKHVLKGYEVDNYFIATDKTTKQILDKKRREAYNLLKKYTLRFNTDPEELETDWEWISEDKAKFQKLHTALKQYLAETDVDGYAVKISEMIG
jgi:hypothetical protein